MQWSNPGHEFDEIYPEISAEYQGKSIVIYGAGMMGGRIYDAISRLSCLTVSAFFDRDEGKKEYKSLPVYHKDFYRQYLEEKGNVILVIGLPDDIGEKVKKEFASAYGLDTGCCKLYSEFVMHDFPVMALYQSNRVFLDSISMIITEQCTLKCEKCAIMLPYFQKAEQYPLERLKQEADKLFSKVDLIGNYTLTGGEPLLSRDLAEMIRYLGEKYRAQIGSFKIITNGTVLPSQELLDLMLQYEMAVDISDYTAGVPAIKPRVDEVREMFECAGIPTYFLSSVQWVDFGFESVDHHYSCSQLQAFFNYCHTRCRGYAGGKIRYCINAYFAERTLNGREDVNNTFDIFSMENSEEERKRLVEFDLGYNGNGFLGMCQHCNGTCEINTHFIEVGKQCSSH